MRLLLAAALAIPLGLDLYLPVPEDNPLTAEKIELGRRLFADRRLSRDGTIACSSCHDPERAFSTDQPRAIGVFGRVGRRNAPALVNRVPYMHDGSIATLGQVVDFYSDGGRPNPFIDPEIRPLELTTADKAALVAFLRSLTGTLTASGKRPAS